MVFQIVDAVKLVCGVRALNGIKLSLEAGQRVIVNGLYAYELIDVICGEPLEQGSILIEGVPLKEAQSRVGIVTREAALPPKLKVIDCVRLCGGEAAYEFLKKTGIEALKNARVDRLSLFERKLTMLAGAAARRPALCAVSLFGLNAREQERLWQAFEALPEGCALLAADALPRKGVKEYTLKEGTLI